MIQAPRPKRFQIRLRTLLVLCGALGATSGLLASQLMAIAHIFQNVQELERHGVRIDSNFYERYGLFPWQRSGPWRAVLEWTIACPDEINTAFVQPARIHGLMEQLGTMATVRRVNLAASDVSSEDVAHLRNLSNLEDLVLAATAIDDSALDSLIGLPHLRILDLSETSISDAALPRIASIRSLESVNLVKTDVSRQGLRDLRRARPDLTVSRPNRKKMRTVAQNTTAPSPHAISGQMKPG